MYQRSFEKHIPRQLRRHVRIVKFREAEGRLAQLAVLLVRVRKPLHEAFLVDILDAATAFARVEERLFGAAFAAAYAACWMGLGVRLAGSFGFDGVFPGEVFEWDVA